MRVKATKLGFYDHKRRYEGDVFHLHDPKLFSEKWMINLDDKQQAKVIKEDLPEVEEPEVTSEEDVI